jgi:hypothetical protein
MTRPTMEDLRAKAKELVDDYLACDLKNDEAWYMLDDGGHWTMQVIPDWTQDTGVTVKLFANIKDSQQVYIGELTDL